MPKLQVGKATVELLANEDYSDWEDEELLAGRRRNSRGHWVGKSPKVVPLKLLQELNRRSAAKGVLKLTVSLNEAIDYICEVAAGRAVPDKDRIHACEVVMNRVLGMQQQRVELTTEADNPYAQAGVRQAIVVRKLIDANSTEEEEDPFES